MDDKNVNQDIQLQGKECEKLPSKLSLTVKEVLRTSNLISMFEPLSSDSPMEIDLLGRKGKEATDKEN